MTACMPRTNGFELRLLNASDRARQARVRFQPRPKTVVRISLGGEPQEPLDSSNDGVTLSLRPWEIATLRVSR